MEMTNSSFTSNIYVLLLLIFSQEVCSAMFSQNQTDYIAMLQFKNQIFEDPHGTLASWNMSQHYCQWQGITCGRRHKRITGLNLTGKDLFGTISPSLGNLSFLRYVNLGDNRLYGKIPREIGNLFRLRHLDLMNNTLTGGIPANLSHCLELTSINIRSNELTGEIPSDIGSLKRLEVIDLGKNNLTGEIPMSFGNLSSLEKISLTYNNFVGTIPEEMGLLTKLSYIAVGDNALFGMIPLSLYNTSTMAYLLVATNLLHGKLPANIGLTLPNLRILAVGGNNFHGTIPASISNATMLEQLHLSYNNFQGHVPSNLGDHLPKLSALNLEINHLGSNSTGDLNWITSLSNCSKLQKLYIGMNNFGGELPNSIGNLSNQLRQLGLGNNKISGRIPTGLENLRNLFVLGMELNLFTGAIPSYIGNLRNLQGLSLMGNKFSGQIPASFCNDTSLSILVLWNNMLEGNIPSNLGNCQRLKVLNISLNRLVGRIPKQIFSLSSLSRTLDLSYNMLSGSLPLEVGKLKDLRSLHLSENMLSGEIPRTIGDCISLEYLYLKGNSFQGTIPSTLASLKGLQHLDLSSNNLTGQIPKDLEKLLFLQHLNLSFNDLEGEVPKHGIFANASLISLIGNHKLCGGITELHLPSCSKQRRKHFVLILIVVFSTIALVISTVLALYLIIYKKKEKKKDASSSLDPNSDKLLRVSYHELYKATDGFSPRNLIGSGSFGSVYKGKLHNHHKEVAIKVLDHQKSGTSKSFMAECEVFRNSRHRNLVTIISFCSSIDFKGEEFQALVYELMENGNLDMWLHPRPDDQDQEKKLNLLQRLNIAVDVAAALQYLHSHCAPTIVHCDLKPSNILLDNDLTAHVGDFGLAKILFDHTNNSSQLTISNVLRGSIGYLAPEYAMGDVPSPKGDVYSFGILLLEMFTAKSPTEDMFIDAFDLHNYVKQALPEQVLNILDPTLLAEMGLEMQEQKRFKIQYLISVFKIGLVCSNKFQKDRVSMDHVYKELSLTRNELLGLGVRKRN